MRFAWQKSNNSILLKSGITIIKILTLISRNDNKHLLSVIGGGHLEFPHETVDEENGNSYISVYTIYIVCSF